MICLLLILMLREPDPAPTAPGGFLEVRLLDLERSSESYLFTVDFDTPWTQSSLTELQADFLSWGGAHKVVCLQLEFNPASEGSW